MVADFVFMQIVAPCLDFISSLLFNMLNDLSFAPAFNLFYFKPKQNQTNIIRPSTH